MMFKHINHAISLSNSLNRCATRGANNCGSDHRPWRPTHSFASTCLHEFPSVRIPIFHRSVLHLALTLTFFIFLSLLTASRAINGACCSRRLAEYILTHHMKARTSTTLPQLYLPRLSYTQQHNFVVSLTVMRVVRHILPRIVSHAHSHIIRSLPHLTQCSTLARNYECFGWPSMQWPTTVAWTPWRDSYEVNEIRQLGA